MKNIYDYSYQELIEYFKEINEKPFRVKQLYSWIYQKQVNSFDEMSNISKDLINKLNDEFSFDLLEINQKQESSDGTIKYLFKLKDNSLIETVLMIHPYGESLCVTSQVGCNMGCGFCASGLIKKQRDLSAGEIVSQIMSVERDLSKRISHVVVMGTGEPFDNYDNVMKFIRIINDPNGLAIGARHITVSTCGIIPRIKDYANEGIQTNLAISLHASNDKIRDEIMPINKSYPLDSLRDALSYYIDKTNRRVTIEYILLKDVNDSIINARQLAHYLRGLNVYVNLIPYNSVNELVYIATDSEAIEKFKNELIRLHINVTLRKEHGRDIDGACGQLRSKVSEVK